jgi:hypothetical protein
VTLHSWVSGFQLFKRTYSLNLQRFDPAPQRHNRDLDPYGGCYEEDPNLKQVPLVNISGVITILILSISPGENDLSALQLTLLADMKNQKFKHKNKRNTREEKTWEKYNQKQMSGHKFGPNRV